MIIHSHDSLPPVLTTEPASWDGLVGLYWPATPEGARDALAHHCRYFESWTPDEAIVQLAAEGA